MQFHQSTLNHGERSRTISEKGGGNAPPTKTQTSAYLISTACLSGNTYRIEMLCYGYLPPLQK